MGGTPAGSPLIGWLSSTIGVRQTMTLCGLVTTLSVLAIYTRFRSSLDAPDSFLIEDVLETPYDNK